jgi:hypothetical protein
MTNDTRFDFNPCDNCSSIVAKLIQSSADARRVFLLLQDRFARGSEKTREAISTLGNVLMCWDAHEPAGELAHERSYWLTVADSSIQVGRELSEEYGFFGERCMGELLLQALAMAATKRLAAPVNKNPVFAEKQSCEGRNPLRRSCSWNT